MQSIIGEWSERNTPPSRFKGKFSPKLVAGDGLVHCISSTDTEYMCINEDLPYLTRLHFEAWDPKQEDSDEPDMGRSLPGSVADVTAVAGKSLGPLL